MFHSTLKPRRLALCLWALLAVVPAAASTPADVATGADRMDLYLPMLTARRVALVVNQTSVVRRSDGSYCPLPDTLAARGVDIVGIMAPEHGYRGTADAGQHVAHSVDPLTGTPVYSLYGRDKKPRPEWLRGVDVVLFDLQDVGTRFYTYLSTLYYVLQACGEQGVEVMLLDRPNPNDTIDGPMRDERHASFVGIIPVPLLHGCTLGELAQMMLGQRWIGEKAPTLTVIRCSGWRHGQPYRLPIAPSPNLPNAQAVALYPSLCLFEGTEVSVGRGTDFPFQVYGHPRMRGSFRFTPRAGAANAHPLQQDQTCLGYDLRTACAPVGFRLDYLLQAATQLGRTAWVTRAPFFDLLAGSDSLRTQISAGLPADAIRASWQPALRAYRAMRERYVLYE
jgi:uncharacterized protein YbbC (DUF1343 family)